MTVTADNFTWQDAALCVGMPDLFFGAEGEQSHEKPEREAEAKRICARCPVRACCLDDALAAGIRYGVYGGMTEDERRLLRENRRRRIRAAERRVAS